MKYFLLLILSCYRIVWANEISPANYSLILNSLQKFKDANIETKILEQSDLQSAVIEGTKSVKSIMTNLFGSKKQISQALLDYSNNKDASLKEKATTILALNYLRLTSAILQSADDQYSKRSEYSENDIKKMKEAFEKVILLSDKMKAYASRLTSEQIKYVAQDNPHPNIPRFIMWPLGTTQTCTEEMVQKIRSDIGAENFKALGSSLMLTGSAYEGLYELLYLRRIIEILKTDSSNDAKIILSFVVSNLNENQPEMVYTGFIKFITQGENEFIKYCGGKCSKLDARLFFQGFARKYPFCLGVVNTEYPKFRSRLR